MGSGSPKVAIFNKLSSRSHQGVIARFAANFNTVDPIV